MTRTTTINHRAAAAFTGLGLPAGLHRRELTHFTDHPGGTQRLSAHTRSPVLGTIVAMGVQRLGSEAV